VVRVLALVAALNGCYLMGPLVLGVLPLWLCFTSQWWWLGLALITAYLYLSFDGAEHKLGRPWQWFHENPVFAYIFEAFPLRIQKTADLDPKQVCVFVRRRFVVGMLTERALSVFSALQLRIRCASSRNARPQPSCLLLQQEG